MPLYPADTIIWAGIFGAFIIPVFILMYYFKKANLKPTPERMRLLP